MTEASRPRRQSFKAHKPRKEMRFGSYILGSTLGEGEFGKVILGWRRDDKQPSQVAIKFIRRDTIPKGSERESKVRREINALKNLSHPNIIRLEDVCQNDKYIGIVLDYVSGGELFDYILQNRYLKDSMACRLFAQLVSGVYYMHSKGLVHRDLKLENLLLDKRKNIIITDFGFVNEFSHHNELMRTSCGSPCYAAPELVISSEPYEARKADVWSCGVILYAMLAGYLPFDDDPQNQDGDNISRLYQYITTTNLTFPEYIEPIQRDLLRRILVSNPKRRISLREVRAHQWLAPHAPFLSITPSEWDINNKTSRSTSKASQGLSSSIPKNEYRRYSLIEQTTNRQTPNPLPPQTSSSHATALPASTSSTSISEAPFMKSHQRSNSVQSYKSASLALQAVVDADEVRVQQKQQQEQVFMPSSHSLYNIDKATRKSSFSQQTAYKHQNIPRSTTHTGIPSLVNNNEQSTTYSIEESPVKKTHDESLPQPSHQIKNDDFVKPKVPMNSHHFSNPGAQKLPGPPKGRKPRPTSYHPGAYSISTVENPSPHSQEQQDNSSALPEASRIFTRSDSVTSIVSINNHNISQPSVVLSSAEGDIITPRSPNTVPLQLYSSPEKQERLPDDEKTGSEINEKPKEAETNQQAIANNYENRPNRYSAIMGADFLFDKIFGPSPSAEMKVKSKEDLIKLNSPDTLSNLSNTASNVSTRNTSYQGSSVEQRKPTLSSIQSKNQASNANQNSSQTSNKTKRFSFLSFYHQQQPNELEKPVPKKKVLEPSKDVNIVNNNNDNKVHERANRDSVMTYTSFAPKKEPSTAKRVMDFFKRRSLRIG